MEKLPNYQKVHRNLLKKLPKRTKDVVERRFGLEKDERETLEAIGSSYGVCRERIRQIEESGISLIKKEIKNSPYQNIFRSLSNYLKERGDLRREDLLLSQASNPKVQNQTLFWLTLGEPFLRFSENQDIYPLWTINPNSLDLAQKVINSFVNKFEIEKRLFSEEEAVKVFNKELKPDIKLKRRVLLSYLEISKKIEQNPEGLFGLQDWPEVSPRGVKDKAYLALKKYGRPLHFREVAKAIDGLSLTPKSSTLPQTVHNELIRDPRFVLVGRGMYALKEWGYSPGQVKDVISNVLKESKRPLSKEEIVEKVLSQRIVKENTILLSLQNKDYFSRTPKGKYTVKES